MKQVIHRGITGNSYQSIPIHAALGVHEGAFNILKDNLPEGATILDIAAGSGAFTRRLLDAGFKVDANELEISGWSVPEITPTKFNLNQALPSDHNLGKFDAVAAIEVIEHLENPRLFLENCLQLVKPGGFILITTPNITARCSRVRFLRAGDFYHFSEKTTYETGHITIIPHWLMRIHAESVGLKVLSVQGLGKYPGLIETTFSALKILLTKFRLKPFGAAISEILLSGIIRQRFAEDSQSICYAILLSKSK